MPRGSEQNRVAVPIGPFAGGLNQLEDPRLIDDGQLAICQNMDIGRAGELTVRPGLRLIGSNTANVRLVGTALLGTNTTRAFYRAPVTQTLAYADGASILASATWSSVGSTVAGATEKVVQYNNSGAVPTAWFIPKDVQPGGSTAAQGVSFNLNTNTAATVAAMPRGSGAVIFKDRLFIFGPVDANNTASQRVYYSAATDFTSFPAANFFDINPGDGEGVTAAFVSQDSIVFFKRHSTYVLFYDTDPGLGTLRRVNSAIGATGPDAVQQYENALYVVDERTIYRIQNLLFVDIGKNLNLRSRRTTVTFGGAFQDFVYIFGSKIMFVVYTGRAVPYEYYVYNTEIEAWTQYTFVQQPERFYRTISSTNFEDAIASKSSSQNLYVFSPFRSDDSAFGDYPYSITPVVVRTKKYSFDAPALFKRMFWWGMDMYLTGTINMQVIADSVNTSVTASLQEAVGNTQPSFLKAFIPTRGRYFEFALSSAYANQRLLVFPGVAYIGTHAAVEMSANV